jgi:hypothetical protein
MRGMNMTSSDEDDSDSDGTTQSQKDRDFIVSDNSELSEEESYMTSETEF